LYDKPFRTFERNTLVLSKQDIARVLKAILQEAKIQTKDALFSLPDFSSFFTHFELPPMTKEELPEAVAFEARRHVPLPLSEVTFDWQLLEGTFEQKTPLKILMVAVPKEIVNQYQEMRHIPRVTATQASIEQQGTNIGVNALRKRFVWWLARVGDSMKDHITQNASASVQVDVEGPAGIQALAVSPADARGDYHIRIDVSNVTTPDRATERSEWADFIAIIQQPVFQGIVNPLLVWRKTCNKFEQDPAELSFTEEEITEHAKADDEREQQQQQMMMQMAHIQAQGQVDAAKSKQQPQQNRPKPKGKGRA